MYQPKYKKMNTSFEVLLKESISQFPFPRGYNDYQKKDTS